MKARIEERGNGLPGSGERIYHSDTDTVYEISAIDGPIHTAGGGGGNYIYVNVVDTGLSAGDLSDAEWDELADVRIILEEDEDHR